MALELGADCVAVALELGADCAEPGGYLSGSYNSGWLLVLERFADSLGSASGGAS